MSEVSTWCRTQALKLVQGLVPPHLDGHLTALPLATVHHAVGALAQCRPHLDDVRLSGVCRGEEGDSDTVDQRGR